MFKIMGPFAFVSVQPNTITIDEHGIFNTVLVDRATIALSNKPPTNASQCSPVEEDLPTDLVTTGKPLKQN